MYVLVSHFRKAINLYVNQSDIAGEKGIIIITRLTD